MTAYVWLLVFIGGAAFILLAIVWTFVVLALWSAVLAAWDWWCEGKGMRA
jgi:hypothetical protein